MDEYSELLAKISALEVKLKVAEDLIGKLMRLVIEGNGRPSIQSQLMLLEQQLTSIKELSDKEDTLIRGAIEKINKSLEKPSDEKKGKESSSSAITIVLAIITSITTILGMLITTAPSLMGRDSSAPIDLPSQEEGNLINESEEHYKYLHSSNLR